MNSGVGGHTGDPPNLEPDSGSWRLGPYELFGKAGAWTLRRARGEHAQGWSVEAVTYLQARTLWECGVTLWESDPDSAP